MSTQARSQAVPIPEQQTLVLEVRLNGALSPLLWQFDLLPDGTLATSAERLRLLGFDLALLGVSGEQPLVKLTDLPGVSYRYLDSLQSVEIDAADAALVPVVLDAGVAPRPIDPDRIEANLGLVLNYSLFADVSDSSINATGQYEVRLLSPWGALTTTGFGNFAVTEPATTGHVRLDTFWRYVDARRAINGSTCQTNLNDQNGVEFTINVSATVAAGCTLGTIGKIDFGNQSGLFTRADAAGSVQITCPLSRAWTLMFDGGRNASAGTRRMRSATGAYVPYGIYRDANRSNPILIDGTIPGTGTGVLQTTQVYGRTQPASPPPVGTYQDFVVVTLSF